MDTIDDDYLPPDSPPIADEAGFAALLDDLVAEEAPRLFAVCQEYGERVDGCIAAWGLAFDDHVDVVAVDGRSRISLRSLEMAVAGYADPPHVSTRVIWWQHDKHDRPGERETADAETSEAAGSE